MEMAWPSVSSLPVGKAHLYQGTQLSSVENFPIHFLAELPTKNWSCVIVAIKEPWASGQNVNDLNTVGQQKRSGILNNIGDIIRI